jgi:acyl transferase domain-containing protein
MLRTAYADAGVAPSRVRYVEAHGTGTRTGDPVEIGALGDVLAAGRTGNARCFVGSVKTNIGHTEGAAGMAGILKSVLAIEHGTVPASLHLTEPNPAGPWSELPFDVPRETVPWPDDGQPRLAGVSAFGITGTNAHIVLEQAPKTNPPPTSAVAGVWPLPISAATPEALRATAAAFADALEGQPELSLADVCATSARHRAALDQRAASPRTTRLRPTAAAPQRAAQRGASPSFSPGRAASGSEWRASSSSTSHVFARASPTSTPPFPRTSASRCSSN